MDGLRPLEVVNADLDDLYDMLAILEDQQGELNQQSSRVTFMGISPEMEIQATLQLIAETEAEKARLINRQIEAGNE